ncbi:hypothetical protein BN1723_019662, partial [Verticillium longisporum]
GRPYAPALRYPS